MTAPAFTPHDRRCIVERAVGWEAATPTTLAAIFGTTPQHITSITKARCAACGEAICSCTDAEWTGGRA